MEVQRITPSVIKLCLINVETDGNNKLLIKITETQRIKFEELTDLKLPLTDEYPSNVCTDCSDHLENFHFFKNQLIRKQNDLNLFLCAVAPQNESQEPNNLLPETIRDDFIEFDGEIEIFDDSKELLDPNDENFMEFPDCDENEDENVEPTVVCREELKFQTPNPQLILFPSDILKSPEKITTELESPLIDDNVEYTCEACSTAFKTKLLFDKHMKDNHENRFICQVCGNIYANKRDLRSHSRSHNFNKNYKCTYAECDKAFRHHHHLVNHMRVHTKNSPFTCNECAQTFRQKYALTLHMKKHAKDFIECNECKSQFLRKSQLKKHLENKLCDGTFKPYVTRAKKNKS